MERIIHTTHIRCITKRLYVISSTNYQMNARSGIASSTLNLTVSKLASQAEGTTFCKMNRFYHSKTFLWWHKSFVREPTHDVVLPTAVTGRWSGKGEPLTSLPNSPVFILSDIFGVICGFRLTKRRRTTKTVSQSTGCCRGNTKHWKLSWKGHQQTATTSYAVYITIDGA
jgi:hypothetical protein